MNIEDYREKNTVPLHLLSEPKPDPPRIYTNGYHGSEPTTYEEIERALSVLPQHFGTDSYNTWRDCLMAVHSELGDAGIALCERYIPGKPGEVAKKFASFDGSGGITIGTLFKIAKEYGYQPARSKGAKAAASNWPTLSSPELIAAIIEGRAPPDIPFDIYEYRPEDGGILDAWDDYFGDYWLFISGYEQWAEWTGTHWQENRTIEFRKTIEQMLSAMNLAAEAKLKEAYSLDDDEQKAAVDKAKAYSRATRRTSGRIQSVERMAQGRRVANGADINHGNVLNLQNGTLDLNTIRLRTHDPQDLLTYCLPFEYDPDATAPTWANTYLPKVFVYPDTLEIDDTLVDLVQEIFGYSLTNDTRLEIMVWLYGDGSNGKTVIIETLKAISGPLATSVDFQNLGKPGNYDLSTLAGMRVAFSTESERGGTVSEGYIKRIVSGETIKARPIYGKPFEFKAACKIWWAMNDKPVIRSTSSSMWRRLQLIPFFRKFDKHEKDVNLREKLMHELPGILNWALAGLLRLRENNGIFTESETAAEFLREYEEESNPVRLWVKERTSPSTILWTSAKTLYADYAEWCEENGRQPFNSKNFSSELKRLRIPFKRNDGSKYALHIDPHDEDEDEDISPEDLADTLGL